MSSHIRLRRAATLAVAGLLTFGSAAVLADTIQLDGDTATASPNISFGSSSAYCALTEGQSMDVDGQFTIKYNGNSTSHYAAGENLTLTRYDANSTIATTLVDTTMVSPWDSSSADATIGFTTSVPAGLADGTYQLQLSLSGDSSGYSAGSGSGSGKPSFNVVISCGLGTPPVIAANGPYSGDEGSAIQLAGSYTGSGTAQWSFPNGTPSGLGSANCVFSPSDTDPNATVTCDDNSGNLGWTLRYSDGTNTSDTTLTVNNLNPVVSAPSASSGGGCVVNLAATGFTDAGTNDSHTAIIYWGDSTSTNPAAVTETPGTGSGSVNAASHTYSVGGSYLIEVDVTDDDGGTGYNQTTYNNIASVVNPGAGLPPLNVGGGGTKFKVGSSVVIKIQVNGCLSGLAAPRISISPTNGTVTAKGKSSLADYMKLSLSLPGFMYNWNTTGWVAGTDYTVTAYGGFLNTTYSVGPIRLTK